jgi:hypothetical protein
VLRELILPDLSRRLDVKSLHRIQEAIDHRLLKRTVLQYRREDRIVHSSPGVGEGPCKGIMPSAFVRSGQAIFQVADFVAKADLCDQTQTGFDGGAEQGCQDHGDVSSSRTESLRRGMTTQCGFLLSDRQNERSIHLECLDRRSPSWCQPCQEDTLPAEMLMPGVQSWMVQRHLLPALWIHGCLVSGLAK